MNRQVKNQRHWAIPIMAALALSLLIIPGVIGMGTRGVWAGEPPKDPILRLETGMHTAEIRRIATDAENRFLVT